LGAAAKPEPAADATTAIGVAASSSVSSTLSETDREFSARIKSECGSSGVTPAALSPSSSSSSSSLLSAQEDFARLNKLYGYERKVKSEMATAAASSSSPSASSASDRVKVDIDDNNHYAAHAWNLCNFPTQRGSVLRFLDRAINGVTQVRVSR
jgi:hypothetical protein